MPRAALRIIIPVLILVLAGACLSCRAPRKSAEPTAKAKSARVDPQQALAGKMLILKDPRDMRLAIIRLANRGLDRDALRDVARKLTMADFEAYVQTHCGAKRLNYLGAGRFRMEVLKLILGDAAINEAVFLLRLKDFEVKGRDIDSVILDQVILDNKDLTAPASLALYMELLEAGITR